MSRILFVALATWLFAVQAQAEYAPQMPPGHLHVRHAAWAAAMTCRAHIPGVSAVDLRVVLNAEGRALRVAVEPAAPGFARCVHTELRREHFDMTGIEVASGQWEVATRFVFPS